MFKPLSRWSHLRSLLILSSITAALALAGGCKSKARQLADAGKVDFTTVKGIRFIEVKRRFSNGLAVDTLGFMQRPSWIIEFVNNDSVLAYYPKGQIMQGFHLHFDHGNVYNFAREWFKVKSISKDSLLFQRVQVTNREIEKGVRSDVNMTFYADDYITKHNLSITALQAPTAKDSALVISRINKSNRNPGNRDSAFAAQNVVSIKSHSKALTVERVSNTDELTGRTASYDKMYPEYRINIKPAHRNFSYYFGAVIDAGGNIHVGKIIGVPPDAYNNAKKGIEGIYNVYVRNLATVTPGSTMGRPHSSEVVFTISGNTGK